MSDVAFLMSAEYTHLYMATSKINTKCCLVARKVSSAFSLPYMSKTLIRCDMNSLY